MAAHRDLWKTCAAWLLMASCLLACRGAPSNSTKGVLGDFPVPAFRFEISHHEPRYDRRMLAEGSEVAPLFQGRGIHYSFIWVGNPPQRVSVIMDTGSHHTAFPCVGCKCGKHVRQPPLLICFLHPNSPDLIVVDRCCSCCFVPPWLGNAGR